MRSLTVILAICPILSLASGCATSHQSIVNPGAQGHAIKTAYVILHGGSSRDVDASVQRELFRRGFTVTAGAQTNRPSQADVLVRYGDYWKWDQTMYLSRLDLQFYDAQSGAMLVAATWHNSLLHGYHELDDIVAQLVTEACTKFREPR